MGWCGMTVNELIKRLEEYRDMGHGNTDVIAYCDFTLDGVQYEKPFLYLNDVHYQSGDIELRFSDKEED